jgi:hypothetical protein
MGNGLGIFLAAGFGFELAASTILAPCPLRETISE